MIHTTDFIATFGVKTKWKHLMAEQKVYVPTVGEEVANAVSHGVMLCLTLAALPFAARRAPHIPKTFVRQDKFRPKSRFSHVMRAELTQR